MSTATVGAVTGRSELVLEVEMHDFRDEGRGGAACATDPGRNVIDLRTLDVSFETEVGW
jgi:hypothetical protein